MNILISCLAYDDGKSGISDYINNVVSELAKQHRLTLIIHRSDAFIMPVKDPSISYIFVPEWLKRPLLSMLWHLFVLPRTLNLKACDLVLLPAGNRRLFCRFPRRCVVIMHDLSQFHIPAKYDAWRMFYIKKVVPYFLRKAPAIVAISESTKRDLIRFYHLQPERITVNYNGFNPAKLEHPVSREELTARFDLPGKYLLYIARLEHPGKNHLTLLKAFELLPQRLRETYTLICPGGNWNGYQSILSYAEASSCHAAFRFPGFINAAEMAALYRYAALYVFPSLYEGFGIPLLEAFAAGIPVICSDRSALPEIGGEAVLTFDPENPQQIADRITAVLTDPDLAAAMVNKGMERVKLFSWQQHTDTIIRLSK